MSGWLAGWGGVYDPDSRFQNAARVSHVADEEYPGLRNRLFHMVLAISCGGSDESDNSRIILVVPLLFEAGGESNFVLRLSF